MFLVNGIQFHQFHAHNLAKHLIVYSIRTRILISLSLCRSEKEFTDPLVFVDNSMGGDKREAFHKINDELHSKVEVIHCTRDSHKIHKSGII